MLHSCFWRLLGYIFRMYKSCQHNSSDVIFDCLPMSFFQENMLFSTQNYRNAVTVKGSNEIPTTIWNKSYRYKLRMRSFYIKIRSSNAMKCIIPIKCMESLENTSIYLGQWNKILQAYNSTEFWFTALKKKFTFLLLLLNKFV